ncbi:MAG: RES family NAD+ phosphorylase [Ilumatobacteraceae bacterium]|nr:RES family NAD+ phosphorylase [Ilumatobacteraceae bacterium]
MYLWRLAAGRHAATAMSGEGAAAFGGRWNPPGRRMVYTAQSLALATLELSVHIIGGRVKYVALQFELPDQLVDALELGGLKKSWPTNDPATQRVGEAWLDSRRSAAIAVPSALVDARSGERNVLLNPLHPALVGLRQLQRFEVLLDARL